MKRNYKKALKEDVVNRVIDKYSVFEIREQTIRQLYNLLPELTNDEDYNLYYEYIFMLSDTLENYIMKLIKRGDLVRQIEMAELKRTVVMRYLNLKGLNNFKTYDECIKNVENISDEIMESLKDNYDFSDTMNHQYVKQLKMKFSK